MEGIAKQCKKLTWNDKPTSPFAPLSCCYYWDDHPSIRLVTQSQWWIRFHLYKQLGLSQSSSWRVWIEVDPSLRTMAETNSAFRTENRDEPLYNHLELFNMPSSSIEAPAENDYRHCRGQQQTGNIGKGRRMFSDYRTESNNEHLYNNIHKSINKPSSPATESQAPNQTSHLYCFSICYWLGILCFLNRKSPPATLALSSLS